MEKIISPYLIVVKLFTDSTSTMKHYLVFAGGEPEALNIWKEAADDSEDPLLENYESFNIRMVHTLPVGQVTPEKDLEGFVFSL